ncbi:hypothetical protein [Pseudonocardia sp. 73-21]|uniref:hypothetical protein n=1 Tax=Pseudonocardia sp. 73-21 TaxID=1895809 RepID=UPI000961F9D6|nr:hypothetical protein [Pseudonocardia sp. 73-21]OJY51625.1 MAG: hypothetical protein BGP03_17235 [Pseudonocardia sp. 73-21]
MSSDGQGPIAVGSLPMNAGWWFGEHVQPERRVARRVGYATPSAFVAAFRRTVGMAPGRHLGL